MEFNGVSWFLDILGTLNLFSSFQFSYFLLSKKRTFLGLFSWVLLPYSWDSRPESSLFLQNNYKDTHRGICLWSARTLVPRFWGELQGLKVQMCWEVKDMLWDIDYACSLGEPDTQPYLSAYILLFLSPEKLKRQTTMK